MFSFENEAGTIEYGSQKYGCKTQVSWKFFLDKTHSIAKG